MLLESAGPSGGLGAGGSGALRGLGESRDVGLGAGRGPGEPVGGERVAGRVQLLLVLADAFFERVNLLARQEEVLPRVGGELLGLQGVREGTESLVVCPPGTIPVGARADRGCGPLGALIEVRGARLQGGKALSFAVHVALGVGEGGSALCQLGSQGGRPFACARQLVRDSVELFAHLRQVLFEARDPGLERVERGNLHGRLVALGLQVSRRSCRRLVELRDAAHHVLMGGASVT